MSASDLALELQDSERTIHQAAVVAAETAVFGAGVNLAARITSLAGPGEMVLSAIAAGTSIAPRP